VREQAKKAIAQRAVDLATRLEECLKSSGETSGTRNFVLNESGVDYVCTLKIEAKKVSSDGVFQE
jgi:hypothetical protein